MRYGPLLDFTLIFSRHDVGDPNLPPNTEGLTMGWNHKSLTILVTSGVL